MDEPDSHEAEENNPSGDDPVISSMGSLHSEQKQDADTRKTPDKECTTPQQGSKKSYWNQLINEKPDRHIELGLSLAIAFFALAQLILTCSSSDQTDQLISASQRSERAAQKIADASYRNAAAADKFAAASQGINGGIGNAVGDLDKQAKASTDTFEEAVRPYIGIEIIRLDPDVPNKTIRTVAIIKNFGTIPAYNFDAHWRIFLNGQELPSSSVPSKPVVLNPGSVATLNGSGSAAEYNTILRDKKALDLYITWQYSWRNHHEKVCTKQELSNSGYINLGPICGKYISK
jgi:hypothetical protein